MLIANSFVDLAEKLVGSLALDEFLHWRLIPEGDNAERDRGGVNQLSQHDVRVLTAIQITGQGRETYFHLID